MNKPCYPWSIFDFLGRAGATMAFACYLDDSYSAGSVVSLAGYFATNENWARYEQAADEIYLKYGISELHTMDLHSNKRAFKGWQHPKKRAFLAELFAAAKDSNLVGVAHCTTKTLAKSFRQANKATAQMSALGILFGNMVNTVCSNQGLLEISGARDVSFVIEQGNKNNSGILIEYNQRKSEGNLERAKSLSFVGKGDCKAIHIADFWAFYSRRLATQLVQKNFRMQGRPADIPDKLLHGAFDKCPHTLHITYGGAGSIVGHPELLRLGQLQTFHFGPIRRPTS